MDGKTLERIALILIVAWLGSMFIFPIFTNLLNSVTGRQFKLTA